MSSPTSEQLEAINKTGKNIIVSAGAGSGKTFVLKERVLREVTEDTTVDKLIILTFTNNAAGEMKDRIRKIINKNENVKDQASLVDSAYITTFDSFAQSLVKKYNYLLNINKDFTIIDSNIVDIELNKILDHIFLDYYENPTDNFIELINNYCYKSDKELKSCLIKIYRNLLNVIDRDIFLDNYINDFYSDEKIQEYITEYNDTIFNKAGILTNLYGDLIDGTLTEKAIEKNNLKYTLLESASNKEELISALSNKMATNSGKTICYDDDSEELRKQIKEIEADLNEMLKYEDKELISQYLLTKNSVEVIINILKELDKKIMEFKNEHNAYEFSDIAFKAIDLVKNNKDVCDEIKNNTYEIMIDEYQDTSDIQEAFISYIANNNVYMVGDVKQSIYRFRNANPYIFKNKYDDYKSGINGYKIDLTNNFRSRCEVINNINELFSLIMFDNVGGAKYKEEHQMNSGNQDYPNHIIDGYNYNMDIFSYQKSDDKTFNQTEIEAFIIAKDIKSKIDSKMKVMDGDGNFNTITYSDFCILVDKSKNFEVLKKILEYHSIPTTIYKDISVQKDDEVFILKNLITLLTHIKTCTFDEVFSHAFMSIGRSYIYKTSDEELFDLLTNKSYKESSLYKKLENISNKINGLSNKEILITLIDEFEVFKKLINVGDVNNRSKKLEYFINQADNLNKFGLDIYSLEEYFNYILDNDEELKMGGKNASNNAVKIMTIHGSKGLEFPIVYMPYLNSSFRNSKQEKFTFSNKYGLIVPYNDGAIEDTMLRRLYNEDDKSENISEKIRLLYVAVTRAREKFIMINEFNDKLKPLNKIDENALLSTKSYRDILTLLKNKISNNIINIDLSDINLTKDYSLIKDTNYNELIDNVDNKIEINELNISYKVLDNKHFSKVLSKVIDKAFRETLDYGTFMHYAFEVLDFKTLNIDELDLKDDEKTCLKNFFNHEETKNIKDANTYKEHEIRYIKDGAIFHGFIDLLVEYDDHFDIIDYKLSNIDSEEYKKQLSGYKDYVESRYNKPTNIYLYSIKKDIFKKLN